MDILLDGLSPTPGAQCYRAAYPSLAPNSLRETALADWLFRMPTLHFAAAAHVGGARVWLHKLRWGFGLQGASHGLDTCSRVRHDRHRGRRHRGRTGRRRRGPAAVAVDAGRARRVRRHRRPGWTRFHPHERATRIYDADPTLQRYPEERSRVLWRDQRFGVLDLAR